MKRFARVAAVCLVALVGVGATSAGAQTPSPAAASDQKMYAVFNVGPTLGHQSSGFFGVEGGLRVADNLFVIVEFSHMGNVGTSDLDARATTIANHLGGTASSSFKVNEGAFGVRYNIEVSPKVHPYALAAIGLASVATEVAFTVNGTTIDPAANGVQLGADLSGSLNKTIFVLGFGVHVPFATRYFADLGYRYGQIFSKTDVFETDSSIPTQRVILGVGVKF